MYFQYKNVMTFTVIGSNGCALWGSRIGGVLYQGTGVQKGAYTFEDEGHLGADSFGTIGDATINGCTIYSDKERGNVLAFDGVDDYVTLQAQKMRFKNYTIMLWFKSTSDATCQGLFDFGQERYGGIYTAIHTEDGEICIGSGEKYSKNASPGLNQWHHMAITINEHSTAAILYIDGVRVGEVTSGVVPMNYPMPEAYLGKDMRGDSYFKGYIDDVLIFSYVLSPEEIKEKAGL
jgi:hypothetical protein